VLFRSIIMNKIFILSLKAGGTGLNLTQAQNVIHYDLWWNPAVETQATDRAYRIGQKNKVIVHRLINKGTMEERIDEMIRDKRELANLTVSSGERWLGELSNKELKELVKLSKDL
jgi:SNF2 family DNA or RNA helicase